MISGKALTGTIFYTEIARNTHLKNSKDLSWFYYFLQFNNGIVFRYGYYVIESNFPKQ